MKPRAFLDTNVFIYAYEFPASNSARIIELLNRGEIEGVISEQVLQEVQRYFKQHYGKELAGLWRNYLLVSCVVISRQQVKLPAQRAGLLKVNGNGSRVTKAEPESTS
jgi:predicted nucleic acid-binding protein